MSISPNIPTPQESYGYESTGTPRWIAILFGVVIAALAVLGFLGYTTETRMSADLAKEQQTSDQKLTAQLKESEEKIGAVASEVGGTKKDIEATKTDLEATKGKLERSFGDMNVMSGLIARNKDDLEDLRRRGDRNYYEFTVTKSKFAQRVGPVQISLNKPD